VDAEKLFSSLIIESVTRTLEEKDIPEEAMVKKCEEAIRKLPVSFSESQKIDLIKSVKREIKKWS